MTPRAGTRQLVALLSLSAIWVLLSCVPALAHARLVQAEPAEGVTLLESPDRLELRFSEPVDAEFSPLEVRDSAGNRVDRDDARIDPEDARVVLAGLEQLPDGTYEVQWRVTSEALVATPYGRALLVKLGFLAFVLAIGAANFLLRGREPFGRLVVVELILAFGLFIATGFLTSIPPPNGS